MSAPDGALDARVQVYVQTRGSARAADYAFLGGAPDEPWWRAYRDVTAFDHPTVLVTSDGARWSAYLSGIPSARVDAVGTVVRYTLVLDGPCGAADTACIPSAVSAWIDDIADSTVVNGAAGAGPGRLSATLDARFPPDDVQRWLAGHTPVADEIRRRALAALVALPAPAPGLDEPGDWIGAVTGLGPRATFVARVGALLDGAPGRALLLNLVGGADDAAALLDPALPTAVLVEGAGPARVTPLRSEVDAKKARAATAPSPQPPRLVAGTAALPLVTVLTIAVALVVTLLVLMR